MNFWLTICLIIFGLDWAKVDVLYVWELHIEKHWKKCKGSELYVLTELGDIATYQVQTYIAIPRSIQPAGSEYTLLAISIEE